MIKLQTPVADVPCKVHISYDDKILLLGSCFAENIGTSLRDYGFDAMVNPFGTLYNPSSILSGIRRLRSGEEFSREDCVPMGSGAGKICSFSHHTSFARKSEEEFLQGANAALDQVHRFFLQCNKAVITLGTAWCYRYVGTAASRRRETAGAACGEVETAGAACGEVETAGAACGEVETAGAACGEVETAGAVRGKVETAGAVRGKVETAGAACGEVDPKNEGMVVSNCLKRDAKEFSRELMSPECCADTIREIAEVLKDKEIIFTVSPIRHLADGAHGNQVSKSTLLLSVEAVLERPWCDYFPAYEIMMDELRDYRFYAADMVHPSTQASDYILERFLEHNLIVSDRRRLEESRRAHKQSLHRPIL